MLFLSVLNYSYRAIGASVVTIPSVAYLLQPSADNDHGHEHEEDDHSEREGGHEGEAKTGGGEDSEEEKPEGDDAKEDAASDGTPDDNFTSSTSDEQPRPDHSVNDAGQGSPETASDEDPRAGAHEVESGGNVSGVRFKGATSGGTKEGEDRRSEQGDTRKHIPDAKGGAKKRIDSDYAKPQGTSPDEDDESNNRVRSHVLPVVGLTKLTNC